MNDSLRKVFIGSVFFLLTCVVAIVGYVMAGWTVLEAIYMVVITIYGVGYGEVRPIEDPSLKVFTIAVIVAGCTSAIYVVGGFVQMIAEGEINKALGARRMTRDIENLKDHVVVCGFGRVGRIIARDLQEAGADFVVVEANPANAEDARRHGYLVHTGDAADEEVLKLVGVERARVLATVLSDDAQNVFVTLSAHVLNPDVEIIARGESPSTEQKLLHSGATRVVLPATIGATMIAQLITNPPREDRLADELLGGHLDDQLRGVGIEFTMHEIRADSPLVGHPVGRIDVNPTSACLLVAIREKDGTLRRNPPVDLVLEVGQTLVILNLEEQLPEPKLQVGTDHAIVYRGVRT